MERDKGDVPVVTESAQHLGLKKCIVDKFGGEAERTVNGKVDIFRGEKENIEIELTNDRENLVYSSWKLFQGGGGYLIVSQSNYEKAKKIAESFDGVKVTTIERVCPEWDEYI